MPVVAPASQADAFREGALERVSRLMPNGCLTAIVIKLLVFRMDALHVIVGPHPGFLRKSPGFGPVAQLDRAVPS